MNFMRHNSRAASGRGPNRRAIDGISPSPQGFKGTNNLNFARPSSYQPVAEQVVANFNQPEGFNAAPQGFISANPDGSAATTAVAPRPVKKGLFRRNKSKAETKTPTHRRTKSRKFKVIKRGLLATFLSLVLIVGFLFVKGYLKSRNIFRGGSAGAPALDENVDPSLLRGEGDGRINILILGKGGEGYTAPDLTDTIIVASIDPINKEAALLSIPRDLYVKVPGNGSMKINAVYARAKEIVLASGKQTAALQAKAEAAGFDSIEKTLAGAIGIPIHYHVMIDFTGFKKAVDTVGGIDLNAPLPVHEVMSIDGKQYILDVKPGYQHFDGFKALAYARSRHTSPRGDFDRAERQRLMILALKSKILSAGTYANPVRISQLMDAFGDHIETNLTINEMLRLYKIGQGIDSSKVASIGLADPPNNFVTTAFVDNQSVVVPRAGIGNFKEIQNYVRNTLKDGYIKYENAAIAVLNGSTRFGFATLKADELKSYGYNVITVGDAPTKNYSKTILVDLTHGQKKYTKHYLEQRFGVTAVSDLPEGISANGADFVIILGPG